MWQPKIFQKKLTGTWLFWLGIIAFLFTAPDQEAAEPVPSEAPQQHTLAAKTEAATPAVDETKEKPSIVKSKMPWNFQKPLRVGVVLIVNSITKVNELQGNFEGSIDIQLTWHDPNLVFDPKLLGTERIVYNMDEVAEQMKKIWNPDIVIANMNEKPTSLQPSLIIYSDGTVNYIQRIQGTFETPYRLAAFPFDAQQLGVKLLSTTYDVSLLQFFQTQEEINHSGIRAGTLLNGWVLNDVEFITSNIRGLNGNYFSQFDAEILISRKPLSHLFYLAPLILIVIVPTILTFFVEADIDKRLNNWAGSMLALIALSFTLTLRYPALPSDGILSQLIAIIFGYQFMMICLSKTILDPALQKKFKNTYLVNEFIDYLRWSIPLALAVLIVTRVLLTSLNT